MDIAIAGAGIGGLTMAALLHAQGKRAVVFDRFAKPSPVGSGLIIQPTGQAVLDRLGGLADLQANASRIDRLYGVSAEKNRVALDVAYRHLKTPGHGLGVHRATLFAILFARSIEAGVRFEPDLEVVGVEDGRLAFGNGRQSPKFDLVIDAMGARSPLVSQPPQFLRFGALWANVPWRACAEFDPNALLQRYRRASQMAGVLPIGQFEEQPMAAFFWSLRCEDHDRWRAFGIGKWKDEVVSLWPQTKDLLNTIRSEDQLVFTRYMHRTNRGARDRRLITIGDAWHAASPQLGQGANMAMLDALALLEALETQVDVPSARSRYHRMRNRHVSAYQMISRLFTPFYQSESRVLPLIRDLLGGYSGLPVVRRILAAMVAGHVALESIAEGDGEG